MIEPKVGQIWVHKDRGIELYVETLLPKSDGLQARWKNTTGFLALESLMRNYRYDRTEPKAVLHPFGWLYSNMIGEINEKLEAMDDGELISTLDATEALDDHCWWATWNVCDEVRDEARRILHNKRLPFKRSMCGRVDVHLPHMWECHGGSHMSEPGRYYCKGGEVRESAARAAIPTKVSLPAGYR